jgi:hypothetical protein
VICSTHTHTHAHPPTRHRDQHDHRLHHPAVLLLLRRVTPAHWGVDHVGDGKRQEQGRHEREGLRHGRGGGEWLMLEGRTHARSTRTRTHTHTHTRTRAHTHARPCRICCKQCNVLTFHWLFSLSFISLGETALHRGSLSVKCMGHRDRMCSVRPPCKAAPCAR